MSIFNLSRGCTEQLDTLRNSPVFAMSRGGKEVFHTNFISFVLELSPEQVPEQDWPKIESVQDRLKTLLFGGNAPKKVVTWRERSSLDLIIMAVPTTIDGRSNPPATIEFAGISEQQALPWSELRPAALPVATCVAVVVEAKLKALPTKDQLIRYNRKLANTLTLEMESPITVGSQEADDDGNGDSEKIWGLTTMRLLDETDSEGAARFFAYDIKLEESNNSDELGPSGDSERRAMPTSTRRVANRFARLDASLRRIVLSPVSAEALSSVVGDTGWTSLSFKDFIAAFSQKEQNGGLMVELLADYARSTNALLHILNASSSAAECFCRENQYSFNDFWRTLKRSDFQHLRIHDVVKKFAYDNLQRLLVEHCKTSEEQLLSNIALLDHPSSFKFLAETFMSRAQPGVNFEFVIKTSDAENGRAVAVGVQIQGTIYRHFIKVSHPIDFDGTGLSGLARLLGDPTQLNDVSRRWWRADLGNQMVLRVASNGDFKPFGKEAFLYTDVDVATMNYQDLVLTLRRSLQAVRAQISDSMEFREAVIEFIQGG